MLELEVGKRFKSRCGLVVKIVERHISELDDSQDKFEDEAGWVYWRNGVYSDNPLDWSARDLVEEQR